jgi:putative membrane protein
MKLNIQTLSFITLAVLGAASMQSCSPDRAKAYNYRTNVNVDGVAFIKGAHEGGLTEIEASKIAQKNSTNKEVTDFAAMMIKDHSEAGMEIDTLADHKYVFLKDSVNLEHKTILDSLAKKTGAEFDKAYMELMVKDHEAAKELFEENSKSNYTDIREIAEKILPKVEDHLKSAKAIQATLK